MSSKVLIFDLDDTLYERFGIVGDKGENLKQAGIKNVTYIMFGFPTETKEEFRQTIEFLKRNDRAIDLISPSTFGLQAGTPAFENPSEFGITRITEHPRELLGPKIEYELSSGLTHEEAKEMRDKFKRSINNINKYPKAMNFFREHMFFA